ncbi:hypothetical protein ACTXT7_015779 [Hymenolepis weldensis]
MLPPPARQETSERGRQTNKNCPNQSPDTGVPNTMEHHKENQAAESPPATVACLLLVNPNSVLPTPPSVVFPNNVHPSNAPAQPSSKDTVQPSTPKAQFPPQDTLHHGRSGHVVKAED